MSIAIMVLAHKNEGQLQRLIDHLSTDFDVFIHIDKSTDIKIPKKNNVFVYKKHKTYWASFNLVKATLFLLKKAYNEHYDRYVLISGQDLPLATNEGIRTFFENNENEYTTITELSLDGCFNTPRLAKFNLADKYRGKGPAPKSDLIFRAQLKIIRTLNKWLSRDLNYDFYKGAQWFSYTDECVKKIFEYLKKDKEYIKRYWWTGGADEIFFQTILHRLQGISIVNDDLRYIEWDYNREHPIVLREGDYEKLMNSSALFARKFDEKVDERIIERIYRTVRVV